LLIWSGYETGPRPIFWYSTAGDQFLAWAGASLAENSG